MSASEKVTRAKRILAKMDTKELHAVERYIRERREILGKRAWKTKVETEWEYVQKNLSSGTRVWCNTTGTFIGDTFQRGDTVTVEHVQPRAKRIWTVSDDGHRNWFDIGAWVRYVWRTTPPENSLPESERRMAKRLGHAIKDLPL